MLARSGFFVALVAFVAGCTVADVTRPRTAGDASDPAASTPPWQPPPSPYGGAVPPVGVPAAAASVPAGTTYVCPMHADVVRDAPGVCPKCGMTLEAHPPAPGAAPGPASAPSSPRTPAHAGH